MRTLVIPLLIILLAGAAAPVYALTVQPLSWRDTGYDLTPGYRHTITLSASYTRLPGYLSGGEPKVEAGPLTATLTPVEDFIGFHYQFKIVIDGETVYSHSQSVHWGSGEVSFVFQVDVDCDGNAVVYVDGEQVGSFVIPDNHADILKDTGDGGSVHITATRLSSCNTQTPPSGGGTTTYTYTPPPNPDRLSLNSIGSSLGSATSTALTVILVGLGVIVVLIVLGKAGGAKRLARSAIG